MLVLSATETRQESVLVLSATEIRQESVLGLSTTEIRQESVLGLSATETRQESVLGLSATGDRPAAHLCHHHRHSGLTCDNGEGELSGPAGNRAKSSRAKGCE